MLETLNNYLFLVINATSHPPADIAALAEFIAQWVVYLAIVLAASLWIWGKRDRRGALLATAAGMITALLLNQVLGQLWFEPRPFMIGLGHTLLWHAADNAFPSDHAAFLWALGLGLIVTGASRPWGWFTCLLGIVVAWARIYVGVHFPIDMVAALLTATVGAGVARVGVPATVRWALPPIEYVYGGALKILRLSPRLFPPNAGY